MEQTRIQNRKILKCTLYPKPVNIQLQLKETVTLIKKKYLAKKKKCQAVFSSYDGTTLSGFVFFFQSLKDLPNFGVNVLEERLLVPSRKNSTGA